MQICFPVQKDEGANSVLYGHFGSAPMFIIVDTETSGLIPIDNRDQGSSQGAYNPIKAIDNKKIDAIISEGIGAGALTGLKRMGIRVYRSQAATVKENLVMFNNRTLPELTPGQGCI